MLIARQDIFNALGVDPLVAGDSVLLESPDGGMRAFVGWNDDGQLEVSISPIVFGDSGEALLGLNGDYVDGEDGFEVKSFDHRSEASDPDDPFAVANSFRSLMRTFAAA